MGTGGEDRLTVRELANETGGAARSGGAVLDNFSLVATGEPVEPNTPPVAVDDTPAMSEFLVNEFVENNQSAPNVTVLPNGQFVISWTSDERLGGYSNTEIKARIINADGSEAVSEFLVNEFTNANQYAPKVQALADGRFIITWHSSDQQQGDLYGDGIKARIFNADGSESGTEFLVNHLTISHQRESTVTATPDGGFIVAWHSYYPQQGDNSETGIKARAFNADGSVAISEFLVNNITENYQFDPSISALSDGRFVVTWRSSTQNHGETEIRARVFNADGSEDVAEFQVNELVQGHQYTPIVTTLTNGNFVISWYTRESQQGDDVETGIRGRIFNSDGTEIGPEFLVNEYTDGGQFTPAITALANGQFCYNMGYPMSLNRVIIAIPVSKQVFSMPTVVSLFPNFLLMNIQMGFSDLQLSRLCQMVVLLFLGGQLMNNKEMLTLLTSKHGFSMKMELRVR